MAKKMLFSFELKPGMIVFEDVLDSTGRLILPKGLELDAETISKLEYFSILEVPIETERKNVLKKITPAASKETAAPVNVLENYSEKVKSSAEFGKFSSRYDEMLSIIKTNLDNLAAGRSPVDAEPMVNSIINLVRTCKNTIQIFDILYNLDASDEQTYHHSINVAVISITLGHWLHISQADLHQLALAALLHDIGKLTIPADILNKSGALSDEEFKLVKSHVNRGYDILKTQQGLDPRIPEACLLHHERCDGSGYPFGLPATKISPFAKIIAIADVYDAMISSRSYRKGLCPFDIIRIFDSEGLSKYDPHYIMTFMENIVSAYLHNNVLLSDGRIGEIIMLNKVCLYRPIVKCENGFVDLLRERNLKIDAVI